MPLEVLVGQLFVVQPDPALPAGGALSRAMDSYFGGFMVRRNNAATPEDLRDMTRLMRDHWRKLPPPIVATDEEGGLVSDLGHLTPAAPSAAALGEIDDPEVTRDVYESIGRKLRALGVNTAFAPVLDVNSEPRNPVIGTRAFGSDARKVAIHGVAAIEGLRKAGVATTAKHFPGHGATTTDSHQTLPRVDGDRSLLTERDLAPFAEAMEKAAPDLIMTAHVTYPGLGDKNRPATLSRVILRDLLRGEMGYKGLIITDAMEMKGIAVLPPDQAAVEALQAGVDLLLYAHDRAMAIKAYQGVLDAVKKGSLPLDRVQESVERIVRLRESFKGKDWVGDDEAYDTLEFGEDQASFQAAMDALELEGNVGVLNQIAGAQGAKIIVLPREVGGRPLALDVVREQLVPAGFELLDVAPEPDDAEISRVRERAGGAGVVVVATASRGGMSEPVRKLVAAATGPDVVKVGVALLDPADVENLMGANCRIKTFGPAEPQLWAMCQKLLS